MTKAKFMRIYSRQTDAQKANLRAHYEDVYKRAIFAETMMDIERRFAWMREADEAIENHLTPLMRAGRS